MASDRAVWKCTQCSCSTGSSWRDPVTVERWKAGGKCGDGDLERVSVQQVCLELQRSLWDLRAQHRQAVNLPSWGCAPRAEGWGRDSLALS